MPGHRSAKEAQPQIAQILTCFFHLPYCRAGPCRCDSLDRFAVMGTRGLVSSLSGHADRSKSVSKARDRLRSYTTGTLMGGARLQMHRQRSIDGASDGAGCHCSALGSSTAIRKGWRSETKFRWRLQDKQPESLCDAPHPPGTGVVLDSNSTRGLAGDSPRSL